MTRADFELLDQEIPSRPVGMIGRFAATLDGGITWTDQAWNSLMGSISGPGLDHEWFTAIDEADRGRVASLWQQETEVRAPVISCEFRLRHELKESIVWIRMIVVAQTSPDGEATGYIGTVADVSRAVLSDRFLMLQRDVLSRVASGSPLKQTLERLLLGVESVAPHLITSVLLVDSEGRHLLTAAAPSLPFEYSEAINGVEIGPSVGSCGTAAYRGEEVLVEDIEHDDLWTVGKELALEHGLRSCWSIPIIGAERKVLGTFAMYGHEPGRPSSFDRELIELVSDLATVAVVRDKEIRNLQASQSQLMAAQKIARMGSWHKNLEGGRVLWSDEMFRLFGMPVGDTAPDVEVTFARIHPDDRDRVRESYRLLLETGQVQVHEFRTNPDLGPIRHLHSIASRVPAENGGEGVISGTIQDITEHREQQRAMATVERQFQSTFEQAAVGMGHLDVDGRFILANNLMGQLLSVPRESLIGKHFADFSEPARKLTDRSVIEELVKGELEEFRGNWTRKRSDGSTVRLSFTNTVVRDTDGEIEYIATIIEDVTRREELEAQLRQAQKMEAIGLLAGGVAHDFNNLLSVILGHTELLGIELPEGSAARHDLNTITQAAKRGAGLTKQLLAFARKDTAEPVLIKPVETINQLMPLVTRLAGPDITVSVASSGIDGWETCIDSTQWDQVVLNLISNAKDAMNGDGTIVIKGSPFVHTAGDGGVARGLPPGEFIRVDITDTGHGIAASDMPSVFQPFFTTKPVGTGTGLGLSMTLGIIEAAGGSVGIQSEVGSGTTISVILPRALAHLTPDVGGKKTDTRPTKSSATILVAEDQPEILQLTQRVLMSKGYKVLATHDPIEALAVVERRLEHIDILVTDIVMPGMNGHELYERVAQLSPNTMVLYISSYPIQQTGDGASASNDLNHLQKPFSKNELLEAIASLLNARAATKT